MTRPKFSISVRDLVDNVERSGDINFRFSTRSNAMDGIKGHQKLQKARGANYIAEEKVSDIVVFGDLSLEVSGRVDGYFPDPEKFIVEEIKTIRVNVNVIPESVSRLFWGQVKVYACLLARKHDVSELTIRLTYLDLDSNEEHAQDQLVSRQSLEDFYEGLIGKYLSFLKNNLVWIELRNKKIEHLRFPYDGYRPGQREMAVSVYKTFKKESQLILQAPTGIGKTIASLFPAIKSLSTLAYEKVFFLSAKASGQIMAQNAVRDLKSSGLSIRDITLTAKDKICFTKGAPCDAEHCEYAVSYYDKLPEVIREVQGSLASLDRPEIERIAEENKMCPFELSLDLSLISDIIICDYNYLFDPVVYLKRFFDSKNNKYALLVDESHNMVDRGRDMFSADLNKQSILDLKRLLTKEAKTEMHLVIKSLNALNSEILLLIRENKIPLEGKNGLQLNEVPERLLRKLRLFTGIAEDWLQLNETRAFQKELLSLYFEVLRFLRTSEYVDDNYCYLMTETRRASKKDDIQIKIYCLNPGPKLAEGFARVRSSICFSATMKPESYFEHLLGVKDEADWYQIPSPFDSENLSVLTTSYISTTYHNRTASIYELVDSLALILDSKQGNYIVFFPSYAYLNEALDKFKERHPQYETIIQTQGMSDEDRNAFLDEFNPRPESLLGFAVMGGTFGEGIDLKGSRLIGAIIVGVGLPQICLERDLIRQYFDAEAQGNGFEFSYQYPGINRVLQTAGRVIRSDTDKGIVCLIDHRFNERRYQQLLPAAWQCTQVKNQLGLSQSLNQFWHKASKA